MDQGLADYLGRSSAKSEDIAIWGDGAIPFRIAAHLTSEEPTVAFSISGRTRAFDHGHLQRHVAAILQGFLALMSAQVGPMTPLANAASQQPLQAAGRAALRPSGPAGTLAQAMRREAGTANGAKAGRPRRAVQVKPPPERAGSP